ncbi:MAG TPA: hypothetical protein VFI65_04150 [Streptosporangiaceae bacterium]|nr:hypothetical protein [Streptosporangiaceae bacterium]
MLLFFTYLTEASKLPIFGDGASQALQAWDMLHGNLLLHGWVLSDVSFYTTELPQYMLIELVRGLNPDVVHIAAAMTYALLVVLSAILAKGKATGREAVVRVIITVGIMVAPPIGQILVARVFSTAWVLLSAPDHTGTQVPLVLIWLMIDRLCWPGGTTPRNPPHGPDQLRPRWWLPIAVAVLLTWVEIADTTAIYEGALPIVLVCLVRMYRRRGPLAGQRFDLTMGAGALASIVASVGAMTVIRSLGGFVVNPASARLITINGMMATFWLKLHSLLVLFGADFFGMSPGSAAIPIAHLVAVGLVAWAVVRAVRVVFTTDDLAMQVVTASFLVLLAAFIFGFRTGARETVGLLPLGAVLAGRMLASRVFDLKLASALAAVLAVFGLSLAAYDSEPAFPSPAKPLASFLLKNHLTYGLSVTWYTSNGVTLYSGDRVRVRDVLKSASGGLVAEHWNTKNSWYGPRLHDATFAIMNPCVPAIPSRLLSHYGAPSATYHFDGFTVLVWRDTNLLASQPATAHQVPAGPARGSPGNPNSDGYKLMCGS